MKLVHPLNILAQPAFLDGKTINCPHCNQQARVREDGSAFCVAGNKNFAPEPSDGELFHMRRSFDLRHGISVHHRFVMVPSMINSYSLDIQAQPEPETEEPTFHPELAGLLEIFAFGGVISGSLNRVLA